MIKIALCDDDEEILKAVAMYIDQYAETKCNQHLEIIGFNSAKALAFALEESTFDIFFLDVYIGDEMGTTLAKTIRKKGIESPIIFLTTSIEHAPEGFETNAMRYLLKPINPPKLYEALDVAIAFAEKMGQRLIKLKTDSGIEAINARSIISSEAHDHYQYVHLADGRQLKVRMTVAELYAALVNNGGFSRVGSAYIVNLRNIKNITTHEVHLYNGICIPIPRGKHNELKKAFWNFQYEGQED